MMTGTPLHIDGLDHLRGRLEVVADQLARGHRIVWLAGAGVFALQRRHHCRNSRGRFVPCKRACPEWDDIATSGRQTDVARAAAGRGVLTTRRTA